MGQANFEWKKPGTALLCAALFLLAGYAGAVDYLKTYSGTPLPREGVALLAREDHGVQIYSFDGVYILGRCVSEPSRNIKYFELLPGKHEIKILFYNGVMFSTDGWRPVDFDVLPGHTYVIDPGIEYDNDKFKGTWHPSVVDITGELETTKKDLGKSIGEAFADYRKHPAKPVEANGKSALVNVHDFEFAVDQEEKFHPKETFFLKLTPGEHVLKARPAGGKGETADSLAFTAEAGHIYEIVPGRGADPKPKLRDVTGEMDDVKELLVKYINDYMRH